MSSGAPAADVSTVGKRRPTATRVLLANGPSGGSLADVKRMDTIAASADEVALDAFGLTLLGVKTDDVAFIAEAEKAGLGKADWKSLKLVEVGG